MNVSRVLVALALLCAFVLMLLGFEVFHADDPHLFGWLGLALTFGYGAKLVP